MRIAAIVVVAACGGHGQSPAGDDDAPSGKADAVVVIADACVPSSAPPRSIFLNRMGGAYTTGAEDSTTNTTSIISNNVTLPPTTVVQAEWDAFVGCVAAKFSPFDVIVTEVDPGTAPHTELVAIDHAQQIGLQAGVEGVSPSACDGANGKVFDKGIVFLMWDVGAADRCAVGAQVIANSFGLDHEFSCPDLMTFLSSCGPSDAKTFTNADQPCGEFSARLCMCGSPTQNSFSRLATVLGATCQ